MERRLIKTKCICVFLNVIFLSFLTPGQIPAAQEARQLRWVLSGEPQINPTGERLKFIAGVTPGYYTDRNKGSFEEMSIKETSFSYQKRWVTRGNLQMDVTLRTNFARPPRELVPGEPVTLGAVFSHSGTLNVPANPGFRFEYLAEGIQLEGETSFTYSPFSREYDGKNKISCHFYAPQDSGRGIIRIIAHVRVANVYYDVVWVYRPMYPGIYDSIGEFTAISGRVEILRPGRAEWTPAEEKMEIMRGDRIRTDYEALARFVLTSDDPNFEEVWDIGGHTEIAVEDYAEAAEPKKDWLIRLIKGALRAFTTGWSRSSVSRRVIGGPTMCVISGTDVLISYDSDIQMMESYVIEGHMDVINTQTSETKELSAGQRLVVVMGRMGRVQQLIRAEWDSLIVEHGFGRGKVSTQSVYIPSLNATVSELKFYEGGYNGAPVGQRSYKRRFARSETRYIWWELSLKHPAHGKRIDFNINAVWYGPNYNLLARQNVPTYIDAGWLKSTHGYAWGWKSVGNFPVGNYKIDLFVDGAKIATGTFEIY